jgi:hypothetical protein
MDERFTKNVLKDGRAHTEGIDIFFEQKKTKKTSYETEL